MSGKTERAVMAAVVVVGGLAGVAIAGVPEIGSADPIPVETATTSTSEPTTIGADATTTSSTSPALPSTSTTSTTEPQLVLRPASEVRVLVANGTTVAGAAARLTETVADIGHPTLEPLSTRSYPDSEIWYVDGYEPEAINLAAILGVFPDRVVPMPADPGFNVGDAHLVVIVGPALAEQDGE